MKTWYSIKAQGEDSAEIDIFDEIGFWGVTAQAFMRDLRALGNVKNIKVRINSPGGSVFDGVAIHNALKRHEANITVEVYGVAASIASIIAMAGNRVIMPENTWMFIHDPLALVVGDAEDMRDMADMLEKIAAGLISSYVAKSGKSEKEVKKWMAEDTWFTAAEALEAGLADEVSAAVKLAASASLTRFTNLPDALKPIFSAPAAPAPAQQAAAPVETPSPATTTTAAPAATATARGEDEIRAEAEKRVKDILDLCTQAGVPDAAASFMDKGMSAEQVKTRLADADKIRARCTAARFPDRANGYIKAGMSVEEVADALFDSLVARQGPEIDSHLGPENERSAPEGAKPVFDSRAIYSRYQPKK